MLMKKTAKALDIAVYITSQSVLDPVTTAQIAAGLGLSPSYTEALLRELREAGLIQAHRGPGGGYRILGNPQDITLWDVVRHFEEVPVFDEVYPDDSHPLKALEVGIQEHLQAVFQAQSLADVAQPHMPRPVHMGAVLGQFRLKPMPQPIMPRAPNSVFQLSMMV